MRSLSPGGRVVRRKIGLLSGAPATNTGPFLPPFFTPSALSRRRSFFCRVGPWHFAQRVASSGPMVLLKEGSAAASAGAQAQASSRAGRMAGRRDIGAPEDEAGDNPLG